MSDEGGDDSNPLLSSDRYPLLPPNASTESRILYALMLGLRDHLRQQDRVHERDKRQAIDARTAKEARDDKKHAENLVRFKEIDDKQTLTFGIATLNKIWIDETGKPLVKKVDAIDKRVAAIESDERIEQAESRGSSRSWTLLGTIALAVLSAAWALIATFGEKALDYIKGH